MVIQQVIELPSIDLIHGNGHCIVPLLLLKVVYSFIKQVFDGQLLQSLHRERFPRACLSIGKDSDDSLVENHINDRSD